jgi:hypothetical protein
MLRSLIVNLDESLERQRPRARAIAERGATLPRLQRLDEAALWSRQAVSVFVGWSDFHLVTLLLEARAVAVANAAATILHFDINSDWVHFHLGSPLNSWVSSAARLPGVKKVNYHRRRRQRHRPRMIERGRSAADCRRGLDLYGRSALDGVTEAPLHQPRASPDHVVADALLAAAPLRPMALFETLAA